MIDRALPAFLALHRHSRSSSVPCTCSVLIRSHTDSTSPSFRTVACRQSSDRSLTSGHSSSPALAMAAKTIPGRPGALDESQEAALVKTKQDLIEQGVFDRSQLPNDGYLCRFLRARDWDVKKSVQMLAKSESWKKEFGAIELFNTWHQSEEERRAILTAWPQYFHKQDKEGRPLYVQHCDVNASALFAAASADRLTQHFVVDFLECIEMRYPACEEASGRTVDDSLIVMDMDSVSMGAFWSVRTLLLRIIDYSQSYFPETSGKIRIVNGGWLFETMYATLKPFIATKTAEKIKVYGADYKERLLEEVDAENLPVSLGGTCECEGGCVFADAGPWKGKPRPKLAHPTSQPAALVHADDAPSSVST